jgi:hypothetical protein
VAEIATKVVEYTIKLSNEELQDIRVALQLAIDHEGVQRGSAQQASWMRLEEELRP